MSDVVGYGKLTSVDEERTLARLRALRSDLIDPLVTVHHGRVVKRTGDGAIVEFRSVIDAVRCAIEVQSGMVERNVGLPPERRIEFRIGIHLGDVVEETDGDLMGEGVNIAARLEGICEVGGICVSEDAYRQVRDKVKGRFVDLGEQVLKNIARPMRAYQVKFDPGGAKAEAASGEARSARPALPDKPSLAVLPFQNMSGDTEQDYFADGIVEDIITALSRFTSFAVVARNSSFVYKGRAVDVRQAAKELDVRYMLEGSVRRAGDRLKITAQLVDGGSGAHLWAQHFNGALDEVFDFQDRITEGVATVIEPLIQIAEIERSRRERPGSVAAYDIYLQVLPKLNGESAKDNAEAYALLTKALALEPDNGLILAQAAYALGHRIGMGWPSLGPDDLQKCIELARRGLEHAAGDPTVIAHCGMSLLHTGHEYDWGMAVIHSAAEANPNDLLIVTAAGIANLHSGSIEDALAYFHRAIRLNPRGPGAQKWLTGIAHAHMILGNYAEALAWATRSLALNSHFDATYWMLIAGHAQLGRMEEARSWLAKFLALKPGISVARIKAGQPDKDPTRLAAILEGLRLAGLEEG